MSQLSVLIIDDDRNFSLSIRDYLSGRNYKVEVANTGSEGLRLAREQWFHLALLDENLPDAKGHLLCSELLKCNADLKIVFITAHPSFNHALQAIRAGAFDYLSKPFELGELDLSLANAARTLELEQEADIGRYAASRDQLGNQLVWASPAMAKLKGEAEMITDSGSPVMITGETGTGKNLLARHIHQRSSRHDGPFIVINCSAIPENLAEAELFGHEKGAFTGAVRTKKGVFELASGGTLVLDEIGDMPLLLQTRLLTVLDSSVIRRVGGEVTIPIDIRLMATTNADLEQAVAAKRFRADLYYRLSVIRFLVPPLRKRAEDIPLLVGHFLKSFNRGDTTVDLSEWEALVSYDWPGNIRELRNIIERSLLLHRDGRFRPSELIALNGQNEPGPEQASVKSDGELKTLDEVERQCITAALKRFGGNKSQAAKALGISLSTLKRKVNET
ncbi:sigma-54-dependent Fis family transcriptional regulator [candidate division TA06 bacterium]|nr:sigma-54-dependent Fis family transcriptional regulator [candidate division TA06 bacterium]